MKNLVEHGIVLPPAAGRAEADTHPAGCEPPGRGHAVDRAGALTIDDRGTGGGGRGLIISKKRGQRDGRPWSSAPPAARPGGPSPRAGRARPGAGALTRRIRALPDGAMSTLTWDQGSEMARPPAPGAPPPGPGVFLRPPPQPMEQAQRTRTPTATAGRYLPEATPHHQPPTLPGRHRRRTGQPPPAPP